MTKLFAYAAILLALSATAMIGANSGAAKSLNDHETQLSTDGAFRDGLYLGRLAAENGLTMHPAVGRWSTAQDRANFVAGYRRGFGTPATARY